MGFTVALESISSEFFLATVSPLLFMRIWCGYFERKLHKSPSNQDDTLEGALGGVMDVFKTLDVLDFGTGAESICQGWHASSGKRTIGVLGQIKPAQ